MSAASIGEAYDDTKNGYYVIAVLNLDEKRRDEVGALFQTENHALSERDTDLSIGCRPTPIAYSRAAENIDLAVYKSLKDARQSLRLFATRGVTALPLNIFTPTDEGEWHLLELRCASPSDVVDSEEKPPGVQVPLLDESFIPSSVRPFALVLRPSDPVDKKTLHCVYLLVYYPRYQTQLPVAWWPDNDAQRFASWDELNALLQQALLRTENWVCVANHCSNAQWPSEELIRAVSRYAINRDDTHNSSTCSSGESTKNVWRALLNAFIARDSRLRHLDNAATQRSSPHAVQRASPKVDLQSLRTQINEHRYTNSALLTLRKLLRCKPGPAQQGEQLTQEQPSACSLRLAPVLHTPSPVPADTFNVPKSQQIFKHDYQQQQPEPFTFETPQGLNKSVLGQHKEVAQQRDRPLMLPNVLSKMYCNLALAKQGWPSVQRESALRRKWGSTICFGMQQKPPVIKRRETTGYFPLYPFFGPPLLCRPTLLEEVTQKIADLLPYLNLGKIRLEELGTLFYSRYRVPLCPKDVGFTDLKSLILTCPYLSLVWVFHDAVERKRAAEICNLLHIPPQQDENHDNVSTPQVTLIPPVSPSKLYVRVRKPEFGVIAEELVVALVAHLLLLCGGHATREETPNTDDAILAEFKNSVGVPIDAIGWYWDSYWFDVCPLERMLRNVRAPSLDAFVRRIGALYVYSKLDQYQSASPVVNALLQTPQMTALEYGQFDREKNNVKTPTTWVFLRPAALISLMPDFIPDSSSPTYAATFHEFLKYPRTPVLSFPFSINLLNPQDPMAASLPAFTGEEQLLCSRQQQAFPLPTIDVSQKSFSLLHPSCSKTRLGTRKSDAPWETTELQFYSPQELKSLFSMIYELIAVGCAWQQVSWSVGEEDLLDLEIERFLYTKGTSQDAIVAEKAGPHDDEGCGKAINKAIEKVSLVASGSAEWGLDQPAGAKPDEARNTEASLSVLQKEKKKFRRERKRANRNLILAGLSSKINDAAELAYVPKTQEKCKRKSSSSSCGSKETQYSDKKIESDAAARLLAARHQRFRQASLTERKMMLLERQEYRSQSVGIFVSSIKVEWCRYFLSAFPLSYHIMRSGYKKLKYLLEAIPNLVLCGDGGYLRVSTWDHVRATTFPFPPRGLSAENKHRVLGFLTRFTTDPLFQSKTYLEGMVIADSLGSSPAFPFASRNAFYRKMRRSNAGKKKRSVLTGSTKGTKTVPPAADDQQHAHRIHRSVMHNATDIQEQIAAAWELPVDRARALAKRILVDLVRLQCFRQKISREKQENADHLTEQPKSPANDVEQQEGTENTRHAAKLKILRDVIVCKNCSPKFSGPNVTTSAQREDNDCIKPQTPRKAVHHVDCVCKILSADQRALIEKFVDQGIAGLRMTDIPNKWNHNFVRFAPFSFFIKKCAVDGLKDPRWHQLLNETSDEVLQLPLPEHGALVLFPADEDFINSLDYKETQKKSAFKNWIKRRSLAYLQDLNVPDGSLTGSQAASRHDSTVASFFPNATATIVKELDKVKSVNCDKGGGDAKPSRRRRRKNRRRTYFTETSADDVKQRSSIESAILYASRLEQSCNRPYPVTQYPRFSVPATSLQTYNLQSSSYRGPMSIGDYGVARSLKGIDPVSCYQAHVKQTSYFFHVKCMCVESSPPNRNDI